MSRKQVNISNSSKKFVYGDSKAAYFELIARNAESETFDRRSYSKILNVLSSQNTGLTESGPACSSNSYVHEFEIFVENGSQILIKKRKKSDDPILKYLPVEDSFDFLNTVHLAVGHKQPAEFRKTAMGMFVIDEIYINYILQSCNICSELYIKDNSVLENSVAKSSKKAIKRELERSSAKSSKNATIDDTSEKQLNKIIRVEIYYMDKYPADGKFKFLLIYVDVETSFTLIRPLMLKCAFEVATELLNIFAGFGPPLLLQTHEKDEEFFREVLMNVQMFCPDSKMPDVKTYVDTSSNSHNLLSLFETWLAQTKRTNWGIACHLFQWDLNNTSNPINGIHPQCIESMIDSEEENPYLTVFKGSEVLELPATKLEPRKKKEKPAKNNSSRNQRNSNEENLCNVCKRRMLRSYSCNNCHKKVHMFCCGVPNLSAYICLNCQQSGEVEHVN